MNNAIIDNMLQLFRVHYNRVARINLTNHTYTILWADGHIVDNPDVCEFNMFKNQIFLNRIVHPSDIQNVSKYCDEGIIAKIIEDNGSLCIKFRIKDVAKVYKWIELDMVPSIDYRPDNQSIMMYNKDIDVDYAKDYEHNKLMEEMSTKDQLTKLNNRYSFDAFIKRSHDAQSIGLVYLDLNRLKEINDTQGHAEGDKYIKQFSNLLTQVFRLDDCYRIGGDEFIVAIKDIDIKTFEEKVDMLSKVNLSLDGDEVIRPMSSIGTRWSSEKPFNILNLVQSAEKQMYEDKYKNHRLMNRRNALKG